MSMQICSIASKEFFYGVVSACKSSPTKCLQMKKIRGKAGRCLDILGLKSTTTSPSPRLQGKNRACVCMIFLFNNHAFIYMILLFFISTQIPQAVGVAYSLKMEKKDACVVTYFGDGTSSEVSGN